MSEFNYKNIASDDLRNQLSEVISKNIHQQIIPGENYIPVTGKVLDVDDILHGVDATLDAWLTTGRYAKDFERDFAAYFGSKAAVLVNSGSSANLVAFYALTSPSLGDRAVKPGDEVITVAAGFPTTVNPMIQFGCIPVFLDVDIPTYNIDVNKLEEAISPKTKAIMIAHALGNPFNIEAVSAIAKKYNLWLIEDDCDSLGATYNGQKTGTFGDLATVSFYPAHHITTGEGGAVLIKKVAHKRIVESFRDWGRDCWCPPGCDNTCLKRYEWTLGELPEDYDHKYTYSHIGYNLKSGDIQASIGLAQLDRLGHRSHRDRQDARLHRHAHDHQVRGRRGPHQPGRHRLGRLLLPSPPLELNQPRLHTRDRGRHRAARSTTRAQRRQRRHQVTQALGRRAPRAGGGDVEAVAWRRRWRQLVDDLCWSPFR